jgi:hypothetical protein
MTKRRRNYNKPVQHRPMTGPKPVAEMYEKRFLLPKELVVSICYMLYGQMTMSQARAMRLPVPIPIQVRKE